MIVSETLRVALLQARSRGHRQYQIAQRAGVPPNTLSALINSIAPLRDNDERIVRIGKILGLKPEECFSEEAHAAQEKAATTTP